MNVSRKKNVWKNHDFFSNGSIESLYWAGFILGDGSICSDSRSESKTLTVQLAGKDASHLDKMQSALGGVRGDYNRTDYRFNVVRRVSTLNVCSQKIVRDLEDIYGITSNKTLSESPPEGLNLVESLAFIAGLMDADGSYYVNRTKRPVMSLVGSKSVLAWVNSILFGGGQTIRPLGKVFVMQATGDKAIRARERLHKVSDLPLMDRKRYAWERKGARMHISGREASKIG